MSFDLLEMSGLILSRDEIKNPSIILCNFLKNKLDFIQNQPIFG